MFLSNVMQNILEIIFSFPYFLDIIIFLFLLVMTSIGYAKGFWRGTFRLLFVIIFLVIAWFTLVDTFANYISDTLLSQLGITFKVGEQTATSIKELIVYSVEYAKEAEIEIPAKFLDDSYVTQFAFAISKSLAWLFIIIFTQFVSWIISGILYFLIIRLIIPERVRKIKLRLLGALMGLIQAVVITFAFMVSFSDLSPAFKIMKNPGEGALSWCNPILRLVFGGLDPHNSMLSPYISGLEENMSDTQFNFSLEGQETNYDLSKELNEFIELMNSLVITPEEPEPPEPVTPEPSDSSNSGSSTSIPGSETSNSENSILVPGSEATDSENSASIPSSEAIDSESSVTPPSSEVVNSESVGELEVLA